MKKTNFFGMVALLVCTAVIAITSSCSDIEDAPDIDIVEMEEDHLPPVDSMKEKINLKTYVFEYPYTNTAKALVNRISNRAATLDASVETIVFHDNSIRSFTANDYKSIAQLLARGGNFVYSEPTHKGFDILIRNLQTIGFAESNLDNIQFTEKGLRSYDYIINIKEDASGLMSMPIVDNGDDNGVLFDVLALKGNSRYTVSDFDDDNGISTELKEVDDDGNETVTDGASTEVVEDVASDYICGKHADNVASWLGEADDYEALMAKGHSIVSQIAANEGKAVLSEIANAQTHHEDFRVALNKWKVAPVTVDYEIWSLNDSEGTDYYYINQELKCKASGLNCGPTKTDTWVYGRSVNNAFTDCGKDVKAYWAYLTRLSSQVKFNDNNVNVKRVSPSESTGGTTRYHKSLEFEMSTAFVGSLKPNVTLKGGVKMTKEEWYEIPDLVLRFEYEGKSSVWKEKCMLWEYTASAHPKHYFKTGKLTHDIAKPGLTRDVTVGHVWVWEKPKAKGQYSFSTNIDVDLEGLYVNYKYESPGPEGTKKHKYKVFKKNHNFTLNLQTPPRFCQNWQMTMEPYDKDALTIMNTYLKSYAPGPFELYTVEKDDTDQIDSRIRTTKGLLESCIDVFKDKYKGSSINDFTLKWKKEVTKDNYQTYDEYKFSVK